MEPFRVKQTTSAAKDCASKKSQIVLAGFSQGALMTRAAIKQLPMTIMEKVSAVILWGDPGMSPPFHFKAFPISDEIKYSETRRFKTTRTGPSDRRYQYPRQWREGPYCMSCP